MKIEIPGKTFLLGEYAILQGGPALIACTKPFFTLIVEPENTPMVVGAAPRGRPLAPHSHSKNLNLDTHYPFHPDSPAGKLIRDHHEYFDGYHLLWKSPYPQGGFGGSTAEFLACYRWLYDKKQQHQNPHQQSSFSLKELHKTYLSYAYNGVGIPPSGADLIAQAQQSLTHCQDADNVLVYLEPNQSPLNPITCQWPFEDIHLLLLKTPYKLPTHDYLSNLKTLPDLSVLSQITQEGFHALQENHAQSFIKSINDYAGNLAELGLTAEPTQALLKQLKQHPACLAAKGCGAMGADVIAVLVHDSQKTELFEICKNMGLIITI